MHSFLTLSLRIDFSRAIDASSVVIVTSPRLDCCGQFLRACIPLHFVFFTLRPLHVRVRLLLHVAQAGQGGFMSLSFSPERFFMAKSTDASSNACVASSGFSFSEESELVLLS